MIKSKKSAIKQSFEFPVYKYSKELDQTFWLFEIFPPVHKCHVLSGDSTKYTSIQHILKNLEKDNPSSY